MAEISGRRKRQAEDEGQDVESPIKRGRLSDAAHFKWLWSPPHPSTFSSSQGLWSQPVPDGMFLTRHDLPYSFSVAPEPANSRRPRRRGAISATSPAAPSALDRHLAQQLQQQIAVIGFKSAAAECHPKRDEEGDRDDEDAEIDVLRRELESVQIDAALPTILGISIDLDRKLCLGTSSRPPEAPRQPDNSSPTGSGPAASPSSSSSTCCRLWKFGNPNSAKDPSPGLQVPCHNGHNPQRRVHGSDGGLWMRPRA
ncbi:hypothetical protein LZ31DRAFT_555222 [Colletotrichum somersetense]|nr:hypothetical protein LZ31DRAFT_555222 [Colletotrichum somersetense]